MKTAMKNVLLAAGLAALAVSIAAQTTAAVGTKSAASKPAVQQAKEPLKKHVAHAVPNNKKTAGEAASLERNEADAGVPERDMRDDNRGRVTSIRRVQPQHQQTHMAKTIGHKKNNAVVTRAHAKTSFASAPRAQHRTAELKTGQLTTSKATHLETKEAALHHQIHSDREQDSARQTPETQDNLQDKNTHQIHLKKHNARMF